MKNMILAIALIVCAMPAAFGQVYDGSTYITSTGTVTVSVTIKPIFNEADVIYTDSNGSSPTVEGTPAAEGGKAVDEADSASTWSKDEEGNSVQGGTYRVDGGRMQEKVKGKWKTLKKKKPEPKKDEKSLGTVLSTSGEGWTPPGSVPWTMLATNGPGGGTGTLPDK